MSPMTGFERMSNALNHKRVDRLPYTDTIWADTSKRWLDEGYIREGEDLISHFGMSMRSGGWLNSTAKLDFEPETVEENEETILQRDGNMALLRRHKMHASTPEHVDFAVKERAQWEELIKPNLLQLDRRRIPFEAYRESKSKAAANNEFFSWAGVAPFEQMHPVCGHEHMCVGMALDPDWILDMVMTYVDMTIRHLQVLFEEEGIPDGMFFFEDMGFKERPFMSPQMYHDLIQPGHAKLFAFAHDHGLKVIVHSCGFIEPLVPGLVEAGLDCLQAMEVKAGMDVRRLAEKFGDQLSFFGNIDIRELISNDFDRMHAEMDRKIIPLMEKGIGYILHSDHSIPPEVNHNTLQHFFEYGSSLAKHWHQ